MADFTTIVAHVDHVETVAARYVSNSRLVAADGEWLARTAFDSLSAREVAIEQFERDALMSDWVVGIDSVAIYEVTDADGESVIGWDVDADGYQITEDD